MKRIALVFMVLGLAYYWCYGAKSQPETKTGPQVKVLAGKQEISFEQLIDRLMSVDYICVGEKHDSQPHHQMQLMIIKALHEKQAREDAYKKAIHNQVYPELPYTETPNQLAVGMEMFQKPFQASLDRFIAGEIHQDKLLQETEYKRRWGFDWELYRPIVEFCRDNRLPVVALNVDKDLIKRIHQRGFDNLDETDRKELGTIDFDNKEHRAFWFDALPQMHGQHTNERYYKIMCIWDDYMAQTAVKFSKARKPSRMVILAGIGHVARFGIPDRAAVYSGKTVASIAIVIDGNADDASQGEPEVPTDYVIHFRP